VRERLWFNHPLVRTAGAGNINYQFLITQATIAYAARAWQELAEVLLLDSTLRGCLSWRLWVGPFVTPTELLRA
jgi:hypothetical protein